MSTTRSESDMLRLLDQLTVEHHELLPRVGVLLELAGARSVELGRASDAMSDLLGPTLDEHIGQEDDLLFPAYARESGNEGLVALFVQEHREIQSLRDELLALRRNEPAGGEAALADLVPRLGDLLTSHMSREEEILFPSARQSLA